MQKTFQVPHTPIEQFSLGNGLRVVLNEDHSVPVVSVAVYYDVGSRNEREGRTGFAHLFEHMMFQGSENVPKAAHFQYISQPYVNGFLRLFEMCFRNHANAHSTIGSMEDLDAATVADIREFFRIYYAPNNAVLAIAGDFDMAATRSMIEKYFVTIPSQPPPPPVDVSEPVNVAQHRDTFLDKLAPVPAFALGWKIPERRSPDFYALSLASHLLFEGESARLYLKLVKGEESVVQIQGGIDERRGPSGLLIVVIPKPDSEGAQIRDAILTEIKDLATVGPSDDEMEKLRNNLFNSAVRSRQSSLFRAQQLAEFALYDNDPELFNSDLANYLKITADQIRDAVAKFLDTDNRVLLEIVPAPQESAAAAPLGPDEPEQPAAPPPQVPAAPDDRTTGSLGLPQAHAESAIEST